jgi:poly(ADP-ribose) glycohydrolase
VTINRVCVDEGIFNRDLLNTTLLEISIVEKGNLLDCPTSVTHVEFSNRSSSKITSLSEVLINFAIRYVGGGVLGNGCGQEEIKFVTCPDLIAALFFTEPLQDHEALVITGAKPYSTYKGYGQDFEYVGDADPNAFSSEVIIAIDNIDFSAHNQSRLYTQQYIDREILKAYASFKNCSSKKIATGNWGGDALQVCIICTI